MEMLLQMEDWYLVILSEGEEHQDFNIDLLNALYTVSDLEFKHAMLGLQDSYNKGTTLTLEIITNEANYKYDKLISRNEYHYQKRKYINLATEGSKPADTNSGSIEQ